MISHMSIFSILKQKPEKIYVLFILILSVALSGCSFFESVFKYSVPLQKVSIIADKDANYSSATDLDLIVVSDHNLLMELGTMSAKTYFEKKDEFLRQHAGKVRVWHWEPVPGKKKENIDIDFEEFQPEAAYVFAKYNNNSENRVMLKPATEITIMMKRTFFQIHSAETEG